MGDAIIFGSFIWNEDKEVRNRQVHGLSFTEAIEAFLDPGRILGAGFWRKRRKLYEKKSKEIRG